jgi:hypothetical protein
VAIVSWNVGRDRFLTFSLGSSSIECETLMVYALALVGRGFNRSKMRRTPQHPLGINASLRKIDGSSVAKKARLGKRTLDIT